MTPDLSKKVVHKIESLCELGCTEVNQMLDDAKHDKPLEKLNEFSASEVDQILHELSEIMSIYDQE